MHNNIGELNYANYLHIKRNALFCIHFVDIIFEIYIFRILETNALGGTLYLFSVIGAIEIHTFYRGI